MGRIEHSRQSPLVEQRHYSALVALPANFSAEEWRENFARTAAQSKATVARTEIEDNRADFARHQKDWVAHLPAEMMWNFQQKHPVAADLKSRVDRGRMVDPGASQFLP